MFLSSQIIGRGRTPVGNKDTWDHYYYWKNPKTTEQKSHNALGDELKMLIQNLKPDSKEVEKALSIQHDLKVSVLTYSYEQ
jgi:hypothetical protein